MISYLFSDTYTIDSIGTAVCAFRKGRGWRAAERFDAAAGGPDAGVIVPPASDERQSFGAKKRESRDFDAMPADGREAASSTGWAGGRAANGSPAKGGGALRLRSGWLVADLVLGGPRAGCAEFRCSPPRPPRTRANTSPATQKWSARTRGGGARRFALRSDTGVQRTK